MSNADPRGTFVWHELLTSDTAGAGAFYPKVVSWKPQPWERDPSYTLWMGKAGPIGGVATLDDATGGPRWLAYVGVEDVHAAVAQAKSMGAKVTKDVTDMPGTGTYAVLTDPQGAEFAVFKSANPSGNGAAPTAGDFSWHELHTTDADAAVAFYSKLCGWEVGPKHDMGPEFGLYHLMIHGGKQYVGIFKSTNMPPNWMCYVKVDDAGKAANAAKAAGGRVLNGPMEVPGGSWIAQMMDPAGVVFAVHEEKTAAAAEPAKAAPKPKAPKPSAPQAAAPKPAAAPAAEAAAAKPAAPQPAPKKAEAPKPAAAKPAAPAPAANKAAPASAPAAKPAPVKTAAKKAPAKKAAAKKAAPKPAKKAAKKAAKKVAKKAVAKKAAKKAPGKKKSAPAKKKAPAKKAKKHK